MGLTPKQSRFVAEYLVDLNATQAAVRAGYSPVSESSEGFYTYLLVDPRDGGIFYVGKGTGERLRSHVRQVKRGRTDNGPKCLRIQRILRDDREVVEWVFSVHSRERDALAVERELIHQLREHGLTNIASGLVSAEEASEGRARVLLERLKPFADWEAGLSDVLRGVCQRLVGGPEEMYRLIGSKLLELAGLVRQC